MLYMPKPKVVYNVRLLTRKTFAAYCRSYSQYRFMEVATTWYHFRLFCFDIEKYVALLLAQNITLIKTSDRSNKTIMRSCIIAGIVNLFTKVTVG